MPKLSPQVDQPLHPFVQPLVKVWLHGLAFAPNPPQLDIDTLDRVSAWLGVDLAKNNALRLACYLQTQLIRHGNVTE